MWAWWHKLCERYFANWKKVYKHQFAFFWKIQEEKRIKFASVKAGTTVAWWCRATVKTSPSQRLTSSTNLMIRLDFISWTGYIFQHCGIRGESSFCVLTIIVIMRPSPVCFDVRPPALVTTAHDHLHGRHHHCHSCTGDTCRSYLEGNSGHKGSS